LEYGAHIGRLVAVLNDFQSRTGQLLRRLKEKLGRRKAGGVQNCIEPACLVSPVHIPLALNHSGSHAVRGPAKSKTKQAVYAARFFESVQVRKHGDRKTTAGIIQCENSADLTGAE
jgi:hypothetical protein